MRRAVRTRALRGRVPPEIDVPRFDWRRVKAKILARRGDYAEAERLAREAASTVADTQMINRQGDVYTDLAEVLLLAGKPDEATAALEQALHRYERKGNIVSAAFVRTRLSELRDSEPR